MKRTFTILPADANASLAHLLSERLDISLDEARHRIVAGSVSVAGKRICDPAHIGRVGEHVVVYGAVVTEATGAMKRPTLTARESVREEIQLCYRDDWIVVADKPSGLPTTATRQSSDNALDAKVSSLIGGRAIAMHRLDREASGVVLFAVASAAQAARRLGSLFAENQIKRRYVALVRGTLSRSEGIWRSPVAGKWALTRYRVIDSAMALESAAPGAQHKSALDLELETGRTHQIRVHAQAAGHPLLGDTKFGGPSAPRLMLHAYALTFLHPQHAKPMLVTARLPIWFQYLSNRLIAPD